MSPITVHDFWDMAMSSSLESLPAPGIWRSMRNCGIAPPFVGGTLKVGSSGRLGQTQSSSSTSITGRLLFPFRVAGRRLLPIPELFEKQTLGVVGLAPFAVVGASEPP